MQYSKREQIKDLNNWYVLKTIPGFEEKLKDMITFSFGNKIHVFLPYKQLYHRVKGKNKLVEKPLFPGYLFIYRDIEYLFLETRNNFMKKYINPILNNGYSMVKSNEMAFIMNLTNYSNKIGISKAFFDRDREIIITEGPLKNLNGKILFVNKRKKKAKIAIVVMEKQITVTIGIEFIELNTS